MHDRRSTDETEQQRAHRLADEYSLLGEHYLNKNGRRSRDAYKKAGTWRELAYSLAAPIAA